MKRKTETARFGNPVQKKKPQMKSSERTIEKTIKADHLFATLYALNFITDNETITSVVFDNSVKGVDVKSPDVDIPVKITVKTEKV